jgi:hypothetical protein
MTVDDRRWRLRHLPTLLIASGAAVLLATIVGGMTRGVPGAVGAGVGVLVASGGYTLTTVVVAWADALDPRLVLPFGLGLYIAKITMIGGVLTVVAANGWSGLVPLSYGIAAGVFAWTGVHLWWITRVWPAHRARLET